ncbi:MAG TPA: ATP-binding protein [Flavitalea sp.]|nr:ATP-binding protein [Flavitalea sp.]
MYKRHIIHPITEALKDTPVIVINGARQVGKSTLCEQLIEDGIFKGRLVTMDDPTVLAAAKADPLGFLQNQDKHLIIDEIQRVPELLLSIKKLIDADRRGRRIILTGSADVMSLPAVADSLAGRIELHNLWPLSQEEILGRKSGFIKNLVSAESGFRGKKIEWATIMQMINKGGYPESLQRQTETRRLKWFESYIAAVLQKDIRELSNIEGLTQIPNILQLITTRVGSTINLSDISRLSGVKNTTLQRYMALLEYVFLIIKIPAWTPNAEGQFVKSPKIFLNDTGLLSYLMGESAQSIENRTKAGALLENFVVMEIIKQLSWTDAALKPYHFSIHKGAEVDLVLEDRGKKLYGIEIKSSASLKASDFNGLKRLADLAGKKFQKGIVLYTGEQVLGGFGGKNLHAVPVSALWEE